MGPPRQGLFLAAAVAVLAAAAWLRLPLVFGDDGIYYPDEIYQSFEPAHWLVFGYGLLPFEFVTGGRHWALPGLVAGLLRWASLAGLDHPSEYVWLVKLFFAGMNLAAGWALYALCRRLGAPPWPALAAAATFLLGFPGVYFAPRALSENAVLLPATLGAAWVLGRPPVAPRWVAGLSLLGLSVLFRLQVALVPLVILCGYLVRRDWRRLGWATGVLAVWALLYGLLDRLTWGGWFHSAIFYVRRHLTIDLGRTYGETPALYFPQALWDALGLLLLLLVALALLGWRRNLQLLLVLAVYLAAHSLVAHKQLRFILPVLPLLYAAAAVGLGETARHGRRTAAGVAVLMVGLALHSGLSMAQRRFEDIGVLDSRRRYPALDFMGPVNRLLLKAHDEASLCGLKVKGVHRTVLGGFTYLHRRVPLYGDDGPPPAAGHYNFLITRQPSAAGLVVASDGPYALRSLGLARCRPDPTYRWRSN